MARNRIKALQWYRRLPVAKQRNYVDKWLGKHRDIVLLEDRDIELIWQKETPEQATPVAPTQGNEWGVICEKCGWEGHAKELKFKRSEDHCPKCNSTQIEWEEELTPTVAATTIAPVAEDEFQKAAMPLMKFLSENYHPHVTAIVTSDGAELLEGLMSVKKEGL